MLNNICANKRGCSGMCLEVGHCSSRSLPGIDPNASTAYSFTTYTPPYKNEKDGWTKIPVSKKTLKALKAKN